MIVLASRSPRRRQLLEQIGVSHRVLPVTVDETPHPGEPADAYVERVTRAKAEAGRRQAPHQAVLAADTAVVLDGVPLGKPHDREHAVDMLLRLGGRSHEVLTGVALAWREGVKYRLSRSRVQFAPIDRAQALRYWATGEPTDKAGGYAIQGRAALFVERIEGSHSGIMGLPLYETGQLLEQAGLQVL